MAIIGHGKGEIKTEGSGRRELQCQSSCPPGQGCGVKGSLSHGISCGGEERFVFQMKRVSHHPVMNTHSTGRAAA